MYNMTYDYIVCRYGELSTKGKNRRDFTNRLIQNIKTQLKGFPDLTYDPKYDRLFINLNGESGEAVAKELEYVFGLSSFSLALRLERDMDILAERALELIKLEKGETFKVMARRHDKTFEHMSDAINRHIATNILRNSAFTVDVHNPDIYIWVEIRKDCAYMMLNRIQGAGGYPVGIQGKVMMMLSGGIDSPVAAYLLMKRGVHVEFVHFASPPYTSQEALNKVLDLAKILTKYQNRIRVHVVDFTKIQLAIYKGVPESYAITMMRRYFLRIANLLSEHRGALAIGNGENLGQVASQTLHSMQAITRIDSLPILSPLLTYDKIEIIDLAKKIETYETSILPFEDCCTIFTPKNPVTKPKGDKVNDFETYLDLGAGVIEAVEQREIIDLKYHDEEVSFL